MNEVSDKSTARQQSLIDSTLIVMVAVNLLPLAGVLLFDWRLFDIMLLYWLENAVIGIFNVIKILLAQDNRKPANLLHDKPVGDTAVQSGVPKSEPRRGGSRKSGIFLIPFFLIHYGGFWAAHGVFVFKLFGSQSPLADNPVETLGIDSLTLQFSLLALIISHALSFFSNYIGQREYERISPKKQMFAPYKRVMVLHITLIFGGFAVMVLQQPLLALIMLIALKIGMDIRAHRESHRLSR